MDPTRGISAAEWIAHASERELRGVIADYGEERFAQQIARAIVAARTERPIVRTQQLAALVAKALGARARGDWSQDPATRTFQAVRIFINQELQELSLALERIPARLAVGQPYGGDVRLARLAIASASLPTPPLKTVGRAIRPTDAELAANPRARSATLRVAERTEGQLGPVHAKCAPT